MGIAYDELIKPYEDPTPPGADKRTASGQRAWLLKRGFPEAVANEALESVYTEIAAGRKFSASNELPAGYYLDRHLLDTAREILRGKEMAKQSAQNYDRVSGYISGTWKDRVRDVALGAIGASVAWGVYVWLLIH